MSRIAALASQLDALGIDAFFAQTPVSMGYLAGLWEDAHERFLTFAVHRSGKSRLICPALSRIQAERIGINDIRSWKDGEDPLEHLSQLEEDWNLRSALIIVDDFMPAKMILELQTVIPAALFKPASPVLAELMGVKDETELAHMRKAGAIADQTFEFTKTCLKVGLTEIQLQQIMEAHMRSLGGTPAFCSVCFGAAAAESHHVNDHTALENNTAVLVDFGCTYEGYHSDITRVMVYGIASDDHKKMYDLVYRAHEEGRLVAKTGAIPSAIDAATRGVIESAGLGEYFTHRTGHGIGLQVHEDPYLSSANHQPLKTGNCFSIEPGIYLAGVGGMRLENLYVSTESGALSFNQPIPAEIPEITSF
jgi:Xaa-Pro dipeptidase